MELLLITFPVVVNIREMTIKCPVGPKAESILKNAVGPIGVFFKEKWQCGLSTRDLGGSIY